MIPAHGTYWANLKTGERLTVEAWDSDGHPMVVGRRGLVRAEEHPDGFVDVDNAEVESVAGVLPGGGWRIKSGDGEEQVPVFAWVVDRTGWIWPTVMEGGASHAWPQELNTEAVPPKGYHRREES